MALMTDLDAGRHCKSIMIKAHYCYNARAPILNAKYKLIGRQKPQTCAEIALLSRPQTRTMVLYRCDVCLYIYIYVCVYICVRLRPRNDNDLLYHRL